MSEELTRFPIQPDDRRRSARSSENIKAVPDELPDADDEHEDKPAVPPQQRHDRSDEDEDQPDGA
jgi:hypothetical protein